MTCKQNFNSTGIKIENIIDIFLRKRNNMVIKMLINDSLIVTDKKSEIAIEYAILCKKSYIYYNSMYQQYEKKKDSKVIRTQST